MIRLVGTDRPGSGGSTVTLRFDDGSSIKAASSWVSELGLFTGREFDEEEFRELKAVLQKKSTRSKAAAMIGARPLSEFELKRKLVEKGSSEQDAFEAAEWLKGLGALSDSDYAEMIARRCAEKGYGAAKIKNEFFRRGIPRKLWEDALSRYSPNEGSIDRFLALRLKGSTDRKTIKKAADALYRRGFSWDEIQEALSRYEDLRLTEE